MMMMEDDMIIYKDKNVQLREMMCEMSEEIEVPAKANQPNGNWWRLIPRHFIET